MLTSLPLPGEDERPADPARAPVVDIRQRLDWEHSRLPDREAQRRLRERLRYKHIGTLSRHLQLIGDRVRQHYGLWFWLFMTLMLSGYFVRWGLR
jgi:hypothetical protein